MASASNSPAAAVLSPGRRQSMLKRLSDLNPFRSPSAESDTVEVSRVTLSCAAASDVVLRCCQSPSHPRPFPQDEDAEYEQLKKDVMANTRRLVLEPFIIATAAAVGLNFGACVRVCRTKTRL
jgi:hypothetical protein